MDIIDRENYRQEQKQLVQVISDFLDMGHLENIVAMFKQKKSHYALVGMIIQDERLMVRIGVAVLLEELKALRPHEVELAIPALIPLLSSHIPHIRGEAATLLGIIGTTKALKALAQLENDPDSQVHEIVSDILAEPTSS